MTKEEIKLTFSPKVRFKSRLLFKVLKYFDHNVAFTDGIPEEIMYTLKCNVPHHIAEFITLYNDDLLKEKFSFPF